MCDFTCCKIPLFWIIILLQFLLSEVHCQNFNFDIQNYTINDGLPSNECHKVLQDSLGYIWIATDRGLVRYDGYDFKVYGIKDGLTDLSCLDIQLDNNQDIWMFTYSGKVFRYDRNQNIVELYKHQLIIDPFLNKTKIFGLEVDKNLNAFISLGGIGILSIKENGEHFLERSEMSGNEAEAFTKVVENRLLLAINSKGAPPDFEDLVLKRIYNEQNYPQDFYTLFHNDKVISGKLSKGRFISFSAGFRIFDSLDLIGINGVRYFYHKDSIVIQTKNAALVDAGSFGEYGILTAEINKVGVTSYRDEEELILGNGMLLLANVSATSILKDSDNNLWVSTLDKGLFKLNKKSIYNLSYNGENKRITSIEKSFNGFHYVINNKSLIYRDSQNIHQQILEDNLDGLLSITYDVNIDRLIICKKNSITLTNENEARQILYKTHIGHDLQESSFLEVFIIGPNRYILCHPWQFLEYENLDQKQSYISYPKHPKIRVLGAASMGDGKCILGSLEGLFVFENESILRINNIPEILDTRINEIGKIDDWYIFATQGNGLVFWDLEKGIIQRTKQSGLISDIIENIFVDSNDRIYLSTKSGLSKLWFNEHDSLMIRNYTTHHGLPSNEVSDVAEYRDTIFIATGKGIGILAEDPELATKRQVLLEEVKANNVSLPNCYDNFDLTFDQNNISIEYKTIDHTLESTIDYRYKMNKSEWINTDATTANFLTLHPDDYTFEVQSKNVDGIWSDSTEVEFTIRPPWWRAWWFYSISFIGVGFLGLYVYKRRTGYLKNKINTEREIRDLEKAALQAQMNPHFIFNCLNSIQFFIMRNEKESAMQYLGQFAKLIRQNLNASVDSKIRLDQEVDMLSNYLDLEKLRLNNKFDYEIKYNDDLVLEQVSIPSLLIQPFVENSVIHGMREIKSKGKISVSFEKQEDILQVKITDNGIGNSKQNVDPQHKSVGMSITDKRLAFLNRLNDENYKVAPTYSSEGTTVTIQINLNE